MADAPGLSLGRLDGARRCNRLLATLLDPDTKSIPPPKGAFRLDTAVREAIRVAHEVADRVATTVAETIDLRPPPDLSAEERIRFVRALETYVESVGDDEVTLHPNGGTFLERPSKSGRYRLTGRNDTSVIDRHDGTVEIRKVHLGSWRPEPIDEDDTVDDEESGPGHETDSWPIDNDALLTLLVTSGRPSVAGGDVVARVRHLWLGSVPNSTEHVVTTSTIAEAGRRLNERIDTALAAAVPTAGWWCDRCPVTKSCPAVVSLADNEMAARLGVTSSPTNDAPSDKR